MRKKIVKLVILLALVIFFNGCIFNDGGEVISQSDDIDSWPYFHKKTNEVTTTTNN